MTMSPATQAKLDRIAANTCYMEQQAMTASTSNAAHNSTPIFNPGQWSQAISRAAMQNTVQQGAISSMADYDKLSRAQKIEREKREIWSSSILYGLSATFVVAVVGLLLWAGVEKFGWYRMAVGFGIGALLAAVPIAVGAVIAHIRINKYEFELAKKMMLEE